MTWTIDATHAGITVTDPTGVVLCVAHSWRAAVLAMCGEVERLREEMKTLRESEASE